MPVPYRILSDTVSITPLPPASWQVLADPGGRLTLSSVLVSEGFQDTGKTVDYHVPTYWIRFQLTNATGKDAGVSLPVISAYADLYTKRDDGDWEHQRSGGLLRWSKRDGLKRVPAFTLTLGPGETVQVYERVRWNFIDEQPGFLEVFYAGTGKLVTQNYIQDEGFFMKSIQGAFLLGLFVLTIIISFYYFLVVREKEFLLFTLFGIGCIFESLSSLNDVFLREYPMLLLYFYIVSNTFNEVLLIYFIRYFLKTFRRFPRWDKFLVWISVVIVLVGIFVRFSSAALGINLGELTHTGFNLIKLVGAIVILTTLALYFRKPDKPVRLIILALVPILSLEFLVYLLYLVKDMYSPRFGAPALHGELSFSKAAFFIMILCYLWMMACFNWVLFLRFSAIGKALLQQTTLEQLRSRFFANISHEFRTPLTLIMGPLEDYQATRDPDELVSFVPAMHRNSKRLLDLINQLLDLSRLDSHYYHINTLRNDIVPFVRQLVHSFASLAHHKDIDLTVETGPRLEDRLGSTGLEFYFDEDVIEKILTNLLSNAFKFTPDGGRIVVRLALPDQEKNTLLIQVADTGAGIGAQQLPHIFDRFYQSDDSDVRQFNGSGIGLSLVRELVRLHQGTVSAESEPGAGTRISCFLPLNNRITTGGPSPAPRVKPASLPGALADEDAPEETSPEGEAAPETEKQSTVLLIEDQSDVRAYITEKLAARFQVMEASDGTDGLEKALNEIPDLVISDVMMPGMDGFELCRRLKTDDRTCHIPVILLTARADDGDRITGLGTGADAYVIKPFNSRELLVRIQGLIATRNRIRRKFSDRLLIKPDEIPVTSRDKVFMSNLLSIIEEHIPDERFRVETLAREVHMSVSQINRKLKGLINQTPQQLIRSLRMLRALHLLKNDAGIIGEISYQVGYEDPGYFSKVFKSHFGCLPSEKDKFPENPEVHVTPSPSPNP
jgi:signal transduction histidine kinase/DNA-binding response OmpR family regulator